IGEAVWLQIPAAIERLSHPQEKALLSRMGIIQRQVTNPVVKTAEPELPATPAPVQTQRPSKDDNRAHARLLREPEAFRVELGFLERRNVGSENPWAAAAHEQLNNVQRCLESNDVEGGWFCLHAAQRYAVFGMNETELANRAYVLREEAMKISSWRGEA